jgi:DNA-binding HxlR family transcriptional regulator
MILPMLGKDYEGQDCAIARALESVGERWTLLIVRDALYGVRRFGDFRAHLDIPKAVLSDRLAGLVAGGVMSREPDPERPGRHVYELTQAGRDLWPVVHSLLVWGSRHRARNSRTFAHALCGTTLDDRADCPECGVTPRPQDVVMKPRSRTSRREDPVAMVLREPHRLLDPITT